MLLSLILGIAAAALTPRLEPQVRALSADLLPSGAPIPDPEARLLTFALALLVAAILAHALAHGSAFWLTLGAVIGVFYPRARAHLRVRRRPDYGDDA